MTVVNRRTGVQADAFGRRVLGTFFKKCPISSYFCAHEALSGKTRLNVSAYQNVSAYVYERGKIRATNKSGRAVLETPPTVAPSDWTTRMRKYFTPQYLEYLRLRDRVLSKSRGRCWYCGTYVHDGGGDSGSLELDHFHPKVDGGTDEFCNLVPACRSCNRRKHGSSLDVFRARLGIVEFWFEREGLEP